MQSVTRKTVCDAQEASLHLSFSRVYFIKQRIKYIFVFPENMYEF